MGWTLLFDPSIAVRHYSAPRGIAGMRSVNDEEAVHWTSFNHVRVTIRRLPWRRRMPSVLYAVFVGERRAPGLLPACVSPVARRLGFQVGLARSALAGRLRALLSGRET